MSEKNEADTVRGACDGMVSRDDAVPCDDATHAEPPVEPLPLVSSIEGGLVFDGFGFGHASVAVSSDGTFGEVGAGAATEGVRVDATGCYVIPGLIDLHFHGCVGDDLCDASPEGLHRMAAYEASRGVTSMCPATMTLPHERLVPILENAAAFRADEGEAALVGINMEGPFISPGKVGAQNPAYVRPASVEEFRELQCVAGGLVKLVDVAPEEADNLSFIREVAGDVRVSLAHMCADYDCAREAFEAGARHMTHLFNAMPPLHHRTPGPIAAGAERSDVTAEIIADGVHVHPSMVRLAFELFGDDRMLLISDSLRGCGLGDGTYELGGQQFTVSGPRATLADGTLAGSVSDLMACLVTAVTKMDVPLASAVRAASINPARTLGVDDVCGSIEPGRRADAVVLDEDLSIRHVILRGRLLR